MLTISRRAFLLSTSALGAIAGIAGRSYADDGMSADGSDQESANFQRQDANDYVENRPPPEFSQLAGVDFRFPTCGAQQLTSLELLATGTPAAAPLYVDGNRDAYFADHPNRGLLNNSDDHLGAASDKLSAASRVPYHLFNPPTELPPGHSVGENWRLLAKDIDLKNLGGRLEATAAAVDLMRNSGMWNYKSFYGGRWEDAGNFNYGFIAAALGIPEQFALRFAGFYGTYYGQANPDGGHFWDFNRSGPYGDFPEDQHQIRNGYEYYYHKELIDLLYANPGYGPAISTSTLSLPISAPTIIGP